MSRQTKRFYEFGSFRIDVSERVLKRDGEIVPLTQKAFEVLLALVERRGAIVSKEELMEKVWPDTFVEESNLAQNIYT
ncbi:MAG: winged helix-turn-helix domain-containing protein, partial [Blastocatellia bacterium]